MGEESTEEDEAALALQNLQESLKLSRDELLRGIVIAKDKNGLTYRQMGEALQMAHSWVFKLYKKAKKNGIRA